MSMDSEARGAQLQLMGYVKAVLSPATSCFLMVVVFKALHML
jgi:hypothetical protein